MEFTLNKNAVSNYCKKNLKGERLKLLLFPSGKPAKLKYKDRLGINILKSKSCWHMKGMIHLPEIFVHTQRGKDWQGSCSFCSIFDADNNSLVLINECISFSDPFSVTSSLPAMLQ